MTITTPVRWRAPQQRRTLDPNGDRTGFLGPAVVFAGAIAIGAAAWLSATSTFPPDALLPGLCLLFFVLAAFSAVVALSCPQPGFAGLTYWDVAGVLMLIGVCTAATVEPDQMVRLVEGHRP